MPSIKVRLESWKDIPSKRKRNLLAMTLPGGIMRDYVRKAEPLIISGYFGNHKAGWGMYDPKLGSSMFYVKPSFRRLGVGRMLMLEVIKAAKKLDSKILVYPHDTKSERLLLGSQFGLHDIREACSDDLPFDYYSHYSSSLKYPKKKKKSQTHV